MAVLPFAQEEKTEDGEAFGLGLTAAVTDQRAASQRSSKVRKSFRPPR